MKKEFKIEFIEDIQEFSNEEMGNIIGGTSMNYQDCSCKCTIHFGTNCGCNIKTPKATYDSCPCPKPKE